MASRASPAAPTRGEGEADVDGQRRLARLEARRARRSRRASPRLERRADLAARLPHDGERLPGVDRRARDAVPLREREQGVGHLGGLVELPGVRVPGRERRAAARLLVGQAGLLRRAPHLVEPRARLGVAAARVLVAHASPARAHLARAVVHRLLHRAHRRVALARARVEAVPRLVEQLRARELRRLVLGEGERLLGERHGLGQRVRREGAARGLLEVRRARDRLARRAPGGGRRSRRPRPSWRASVRPARGRPSARPRRASA